MIRLTFLPFVEDWWARMVLAFLLRVREHFPARLVHTFLRHVDLPTMMKKGWTGGGVALQSQRLNAQCLSGGAD